MSKKNNNKIRRAKAHAGQMNKVELSADPSMPLSDRFTLLSQLKPKYLVRAIDETLKLELEFDREALIAARDKLVSGKWTTAQAMEVLK